MTSLQNVATLFIVVQVGFALTEIPNKDSIQRAQMMGQEYNNQKYQRYLEFIQYPSLRLNFSNLPGFDCFTSPEWPGLTTRFEFECSNRLPPSDVVPENVHLLRPADIKVIGAMGDSLTAANGAGACLLPQLALEYRGKTFSHGGDKTFEKVPSLANILKKFNPDLKGYGVETGRWNSSNAGMNVGYPGDVSSDMPLQAERLISKMKRNPDIDFYNDWKLVTLFIGANDLCDWCKDNELYHPQVYVDNIMQSLRILQEKLPRTLVNVVGVLNVPEVEALRGPICDAFHLLWCDCGMFLGGKELTKFTQVTMEYQRLLNATISSGVLDGSPDFTAVLQPFLHNTGVPLTKEGLPDYSYFAPDCFHFSAKGHAAAGVELWNNMMEPVGSKRTVWLPGGPMSCPTEENPYIYTNINSHDGFQESLEDMYKSSTRNLHNQNRISLLITALIVFCVIKIQL